MKKTVVVSLWNDLATNVGQELLDMANKSPVVAIKSLKVGDFQGDYFFSCKNVYRPCTYHFNTVLSISCK
ncbi:hypothetical protein FXO37_00883 [Capsicum annuum]|nr:hypothetical protein FXO37_00883 [Capsicum annuum]